VKAKRKWAIVSALFAPLVAHADSLQEIADFAQKICVQSLSGTETSTTIVAKLNGDANGLARALGVSVGASGLVKRDGTHYEGIPENRLPREIQTESQCRAELAKVLIAERQRLGLSAEQRSQLLSRMQQNNEKIAQIEGLIAAHAEQYRVQERNNQEQAGNIARLEGLIAQQESNLASGQGSPDARTRAQSAINEARSTINRARAMIEDALRTMSEGRQVDLRAKATIGGAQQQNEQIRQMLSQP
jgi:hypothetical protein